MYQVFTNVKLIIKYTSTSQLKYISQLHSFFKFCPGDRTWTAPNLLPAEKYEPYRKGGLRYDSKLHS